MKPQLVMDGGDGPGTLTRKWLWQCDKCKHREIDDGPPEGWQVGTTKSICSDCAD